MAEEKKKKVAKPTALKRDIRNAKRRDINRAFKSKVRTAVRTLEGDLGKEDKVTATESLNSVYSLMDKGVKKGVYKLNKANRDKARFSTKLKKQFA